MKTVSLIAIDAAPNESRAVTCGRFILDAMRGEDDRVRNEIEIDDNDLPEWGWRELVDYLQRRGVELQYDGYPLARAKVL